MKSTLDQLSSKEKAALALLYGTDAFLALRKICQLEINGVAKDALEATVIEQVHYAKGQAAMAKKVIRLVELIYKEDGKKG